MVKIYKNCSHLHFSDYLRNCFNFTKMVERNFIFRIIPQITEVEISQVITNYIEQFPLRAFKPKVEEIVILCSGYLPSDVWK